MDNKNKEKITLRLGIPKYKLVITLIIIILLCAGIVTSATHTSPPDESVDFLIARWDELPHKHQRANKTWRARL